MEKFEGQYFDVPISEVITFRKSVRNYKEIELSDIEKNKLLDFSKDIQGPFDAKVRFQLIDSLSLEKFKDGKIGTYGVIKGAKSYFAAIVERGPGDLEQVGYVFEKIILYAASLNIGTCWLGGTFTKNGFEKIVNLKNNETIPVISPFGYTAENPRFLDKIMRFSAGSNTRKDPKELFFDFDFNKPLDLLNVGAYRTPLEMVRLAPSASNKQPWRIIKKDKQWDFYVKVDKKYEKLLGYNIQRIDIGIAMCHFELAVKELGMNGYWLINNDVIKNDNNLEFIASWIEED